MSDTNVIVAKEAIMPNNQTIDVTIQSGIGSKNFSFAQQTKVQDVVDTAVAEFGYPNSQGFTLVWIKSDTERLPLEPQRPLVSYQIPDGAILVISNVGSGV
jgi:hypothetical protein